MSLSALGMWFGLSLFSVLSIFFSLKLFHVPLKDRKRIIKAIIYSFLSAFIVFLIPIIMEVIFPLPENCSPSQRQWLVDCGGTYINWHYIQVMAVIAYFAIVFLVWTIWDLLYGKLYKLPIQFPIKFSRIIRGSIILLSFLMMLPLAWLRNFLLDILIK